MEVKWKDGLKNRHFTRSLSEMIQYRPQLQCKTKTNLYVIYRMVPFPITSVTPNRFQSHNVK